jgi:hypothetical protein
VPARKTDATPRFASAQQVRAGGSSPANRFDSTVKYFTNLAANTDFQAEIGREFGGASFDAYYSKVIDAISASFLTAAQVAGPPRLGYSLANSLSATVSDNTAFAFMALYAIDALKFSAGYEHIKCTNPTTPRFPANRDILALAARWVAASAQSPAGLSQRSRMSTVLMLRDCIEGNTFYRDVGGRIRTQSFDDSGDSVRIFRNRRVCQLRHAHGHRDTTRHSKTVVTFNARRGIA